jgi:copper chaperone
MSKATFPQLESYFQRYHQNNSGDNLAEHTLLVDGMHCGSCIRRVTQALASAYGVQVEEVRLGAARIQTAAEIPSVDEAIAALAKAGFNAREEPSSTQ